MPPDQLPKYKIIEAELEETRLRFLVLLADIADQDWDRPLTGEAWTARQEMAHITQVITLLPVGIKRAAAGQTWSVLALVPEDLRRWVNGHIIIPARYRSATRQTIAAEYEKAHHALFALLEELPVEVWGKGAFFPSQYRTVEQMAHRPSEHFAEHEAHLKRALGI